MRLLDLFKRKGKVVKECDINIENTNENINTNLIDNDIESIEPINEQNKYIRLKNIDDVYTEGCYIVGKDIKAGEYYFWGEDISYIKKCNKEKECFEYKRDSYDYLKKGEKLHKKE